MSELTIISELIIMNRMKQISFILWLLAPTLSSSQTWRRRCAPPSSYRSDGRPVAAGIRRSLPIPKLTGNSFPSKQDRRTILFQTVAPTLSHQHLPERSQSHSRSAVPKLSSDSQLEQYWWVVKQQFDFMASNSEITCVDFALCSVLIWIEQVAPHDGQMERW